MKLRDQETAIEALFGVLEAVDRHCAGRKRPSPLARELDRVLSPAVLEMLSEQRPVRFARRMEGT
jgi:hypothetical protein